MSSAAQSVPAPAEDAEPDQSLAGVHTSATFDHPVEQVWRHLVSGRGTEAILGPGVTLGSKGESWHSDDGPHGVVRSWHPMEQIRVSWHPHADGPLSIVDLQLHPEGSATRLDLFHEGEGIAEDGAGDKQRWDDALGRFGSSLQG